MKITILDPAMCCSTGVCGTEVDDSLVQAAADVKWLKSLGHEVNRHNISNDAAAFKSFPFVIEKLQKEGVGSLPYILVNDELKLAGSYPAKSQRQAWLDSAAARAIAANSFEPFTVLPTQKDNSQDSCCTGSGCC